MDQVYFSWIQLFISGDVLDPGHRTIIIIIVMLFYIVLHFL